MWHDRRDAYDDADDGGIPTGTDDVMCREALRAGLRMKSSVPGARSRPCQGGNILFNYSICLIHQAKCKPDHPSNNPTCFPQMRVPPKQSVAVLCGVCLALSHYLPRFVGLGTSVSHFIMDAHLFSTLCSTEALP